MVTETGQKPPQAVGSVVYLQQVGPQILRWLRQGPGRVMGFVNWLWTKQRHWLISLIPFLFIVYRPLRLAWGTWTTFDSPVAIQVLVPFLAFYLAWERREAIALDYHQFCLMYPPNSPKRRGNIAFVVLGCLLMMLATIMLTPWLSVLALVLCLFGVLYYIYGWYVIGRLWVPLAFLLLMIPPGTLLDHLARPLQVGNTITLSITLAPLFPNLKAVGNMLVLPNTRLVITPALSGLSVIVPMVVMTTWFGIRRRVAYFNYPVLLLLSSVIGLLVNFVRLCVLSMLLSYQPALGTSLMHLNSWLLVLVSLVPAYFMIRFFRTRARTELGEGDVIV